MLERTEGIPIGIVSGVVGIRDIMVHVCGEDAHAGPLEMHLRRDALVGAARMIIAANAIGRRRRPMHASLSDESPCPPTSHSVVPGLAEFVLDLRHPDRKSLDALEREVRATFVDIANRSRLAATFEQLWEYPPVAFDEEMRVAISDAAARLGHATLPLPSRAGHDAWNVAKVAPAGMIFIPCRAGISHNEAEHAEFEHIIASADVLLGAVIAIAAPSFR